MALNIDLKLPQISGFVSIFLVLVLGGMLTLSVQAASIGGDGVNIGHEKLAMSQSVYTPRDELIPGIPMPPQRPKPPDIGEQWKNLPWLQLFEGTPYGAFTEIKPHVKPHDRPSDLKQLRAIAKQFDENMTDKALLAREQYYKEQAEIDAKEEALTTQLPNKVWMLLLSADNHHSHLVEFGNKPKTLDGCLLTGGRKGENPWAYERLVKYCGGELRLTKTAASYLDQCFPPHGKTIVTDYFLYDKGKKVVCLHRLPEEMPTKKPDDESSANDEVKTVTSIGGAPYWPLGEGGFFGVNCMNVPMSIAAYSRKNYRESLPNSQYTELTSPQLLWAYTYLVRHDKPISCSPARYFVDFVNKVYAFLPDRTVLLVGQGTMLRARLDDGSTEAPANLVHSVLPRQFLERMYFDGGVDCFDGRSKEPCHWMDVESLKSDKSGLETIYAKFWLEGFDRAVSRIYFSK